MSSCGQAYLNCGCFSARYTCFDEEPYSMWNKAIERWEETRIEDFEMYLIVYLRLFVLCTLAIKDEHEMFLFVN